MKRNPESNEPLARALDDAQPDDVVAESLARTLAEVRARRRRRQGLTMASVVGAVTLGLLAWNRASGPTDETVAAVGRVESAESPGRIQVQELSDAELLALFPGRGAGFATVNGQREFILLPAESDGEE